MTPETKWGYDAVNSCEEKPEASLDRIREQIRKHFPGASDREIMKVMEIRK